MAVEYSAMSTLDLIRTLRRALTGVRDAHDEHAVAEVARALISELSGNLHEVPTLALTDQPGPADTAAVVDLGEIQCGGMAVCA